MEILVYATTNVQHMIEIIDSIPDFYHEWRTGKKSNQKIRCL